jgi:cytochrome c peroxidase
MIMMSFRRLHIIAFAFLVSPGFVQGAVDFNLSKVCPSTGLYLDDKGFCLPVQPYTEQISAYHGLWKLEIPDIKLSPEKIDLGRLLFFDPILSSDQKTSCASCHDPAKAFSGSRANLRSSPGLVNLAYNPKFFWDGRASSAEEQLRAPLLSTLEMANESIEAVMKRLNGNPIYRRLFASLRPSGSKSAEISWVELYSVLDSFQKSLISFTSSYDRYILGDHAALNESQVRGLTLFRSFGTRCAECHTPPLFTNHQILTVGAPGESRPFKVPSLRQVGKTAPYMHRGAFGTLAEVVRFYNDGGGRSAQGISGRDTHWHVRPIGMSDSEQADLVSFLNALTDESWKIEIPKNVPSGLKPFGTR